MHVVGVLFVVGWDGETDLTGARDDFERFGREDRWWFRFVGFSVCYTRNEGAIMS